jgi:hypothetical protein
MLRLLAAGQDTQAQRLSQAETALALTQSALTETQEAVRQTKAALRQTQAALTETQAALTETQAALKTSEAARQQADAVATLARAGLMHLPSILLNALPKSAGSYINVLLMRGLVFEHCDIAVGLFPGDVLNYATLEQFQRGNRIAHHHLEATPTNRRLLALYGLKAVIHVRDPRGALLSWLHHLAPLRRPEDAPMLAAIAPPPPYYEKPVAWRLDWLIDNHLDVFVGWIAGWVDAERELGPLLLFTSYEDFVRDNKALVDAVLAFYGIPADRFVRLDLPRNAALNFRVGRIDEWREVMDAGQKARCLARLPETLMRRFAWPE